MERKHNTPFCFLIVILVVLSVFSVYMVHISMVVDAADPETVLIWLTSDHHCARDTGTGDPWDLYPSWGIAIDDFNTLGIDYDMCLALGDIYNSGGSTRTWATHGCAYGAGYPTISPILDSGDFPFTESGGSYQDYLEQLNGNRTKDREVYYHISGNHESTYSDWETYIDPLGENMGTSGVNNSNRPFPIVAHKNTYGQDCYEILVGENFRILMLGYIEDTDLGNSYSWWQSRLVAHSDDNFMTCSHENFDDGEISLHWTTASKVNSNYGTYLSGHADTHHNNIWIGGHWHFYDPDGLCWYSNPYNRDGDRVTLNATYNCTNVNVAAITSRPYHGSNDNCPSMSYLMTLTNGSTTVSFATYNHSGGCWDEGNPGAPSHSPGNFTVELATPFVLDGGDPPSDYNAPVIQSMGYSGSGDLLNQSVMVGTFWVNFTYDTNSTPSYFWLNISNSVGFGSTIKDVNITDLDGNPGYYNCSISSGVTASTSKRYVHVKSFYD